MIEITGGGLDLRLAVAALEHAERRLEWMAFFNVSQLPAPLLLTDRFKIDHCGDELTSLKEKDFGILLKGSRDRKYMLIHDFIIPLDHNETVNSMLNSSISTVIETNMNNDTRLENLNDDQRLKIKSIVVNSIELKSQLFTSVDYNRTYNDITKTLLA